MLQRSEGVTNRCVSRRSLERAAKAGESPVDENAPAPLGDPEYCGARETPWEAGETTSQG